MLIFGIRFQDNMERGPKDRSTLPAAWFGPSSVGNAAAAAGRVVFPLRCPIAPARPGTAQGNALEQAFRLMALEESNLRTRMRRLQCSFSLGRGGRYGDAHKSRRPGRKPWPSATH